MYVPIAEFPKEHKVVVGVGVGVDVGVGVGVDVGELVPVA